MFFSLVMKSIPIQGSNWKGAMGPVKAPPDVTDEHTAKSEGRLSVLLLDSTVELVVVMYACAST